MGQFILFNAEPKINYELNPEDGISIAEALEIASAGYHAGYNWTSEWFPELPNVKISIKPFNVKNKNLVINNWWEGFNQGYKDSGRDTVLLRRF